MFGSIGSVVYQLQTNKFRHASKAYVYRSVSQFQIKTIKPKTALGISKILCVLCNYGARKANDKLCC